MFDWSAEVWVCVMSCTVGFVEILGFCTFFKYTTSWLSQNSTICVCIHEVDAIDGGGAGGGVCRIVIASVNSHRNLLMGKKFLPDTF